MRPLAFAFPLATLFTGVATDVSAKGPGRVHVAAEVGYAFPAGNLERGSRLSDVTFGAPELSVDAAYRLHRLLSVGFVGRYGIAIPNLCGNSSECLASLGHDLSLGLLGRWHIGKFGRLEPDADLQLGYEWFGSKLTDGDTTSSRSFRGWQGGIHAHAQFRLSPGFSLGPTLALSGGVFQRVALDAPGVERSRPTDGTAPHFWLAIGLRGVAAW